MKILSIIRHRAPSARQLYGEVFEILANQEESVANVVPPRATKIFR